MRIKYESPSEITEVALMNISEYAWYGGEEERSEKAMMHDASPCFWNDDSNEDGNTRKCATISVLLALDHDAPLPDADNDNSPADDESICITDADESVAYIFLLHTQVVLADNIKIL